MKKILAALIVFVSIAFVWTALNGEFDKSEKRGGKYLTDKTEKQNMTIKITGDGRTAWVRYATQEKKDKPVEGFVELPFEVTVFSESASVTSSPGAKTSNVKCEIEDGSTGKTLDSDGPSDGSVRCYHSTF